MCLQTRFIFKLQAALTAHWDWIHVQARGLREDIGKKDKFSTVQAIFECVVCKCELKSIKTLRAHCKVRVSQLHNPSTNVITRGNPGKNERVNGALLTLQGRPHKQAEITSRPRPVKRQPIDDRDDIKAPPGLLRRTGQKWLHGGTGSSPDSSPSSRCYGGSAR